jgi:uncharacterized protein (DUF305 family)
MMGMGGMMDCMGGRGMGMGMGMGGGNMMGDVDRHFIVMMIPHHEAAVEMADLALQKAEHPELKVLAEDIKRVQTEEIEQMREWYRQWYGTDVPDSTAQASNGMMGRQGMMGRGMMGGQNMMGMMGDDVEALKNAANFDKAFITLMVPHHRMALMMSNMVIMSGEHKELLGLARSIITSQSAEIERMEDWYAAWYRK